MKKTTIKALGIMNGTSIDAIDYTVIKVNRNTLVPEFVSHHQKAMPRDIKDRIFAAANNELTTYDLSHLHFDLGRLYSKHVKSLARGESWDVIGLHGQTVHHEGGKATLQIGSPAFLKTEFKQPVVSDFRSLDVAQGGEGAPFAPFFQKHLAKKIKNWKSIAFHNLGGISNLTYFNKTSVKAYDTGPANILIDLWIHKKTKGKQIFDRHGRTAAKGLYHPTSVSAMLAHPFFKKKAPKSCGREEFNERFIQKYGGPKFNKLSLEDQLASLTELTAKSIAQAYVNGFKTPPERIYFYGGGINNNHLMKRLRFYLPDSIQITTTDEIGWPTQGFEAGIFAFLATARLLEKPVHLPQITGARKPQILGQVYT